MKRTALILLTAIYLLSVLGVVADSYYCHGKLRSTSIVIQHSSFSDCKMHDQMKNCCKTKKQFYKVSDLHIYAASLSLGARMFPALQVQFLVSQAKVNIAARQVFDNNVNPPPKGVITPAYILNCNYRI